MASAYAHWPEQVTWPQLNCKGCWEMVVPPRAQEVDGETGFREPRALARPQPPAADAVVSESNCAGHVSAVDLAASLAAFPPLPGQWGAGAPVPAPWESPCHVGLSTN